MEQWWGINCQPSCDDAIIWPWITTDSRSVDWPFNTDSNWGTLTNSYPLSHIIAILSHQERIAIRESPYCKMIRAPYVIRPMRSIFSLNQLWIMEFPMKSYHMGHYYKNGQSNPRVFIAPSKYIQGPGRILRNSPPVGVIQHTGEYICSISPLKKDRFCLILGSKGGMQRYGDQSSFVWIWLMCSCFFLAEEWYRVCVCRYRTPMQVHLCDHDHR